VPTFDLFSAQEAAMLFDEDYGLFLLDAIHNARKRVLAMQFIVEIRPQLDRLRDVQFLARSLAEASGRGIDVRILVSPFVTDPGLDLNEIASRWLAARGVSVRTYQPRDGSRRTALHSKVAIVDDIAIVSSHNWTPGAFAVNREAAVAVRSAEVANRLVETFEGLWEAGRHAES